METPFFGGSYVSLSSNAADDRTVNLYPELMETKQGKQVGVLYSTPGQRKFLTLPAYTTGYVGGPLRGSHTMATTNKMIQVYGNTVITIDINNATVFIGFLNTATGPVSIIDNGFQFLVVDGFQAWVYAASTWTAITTLPGQPVTACIQDGFALVNIFGTAKFYQSNLNDMTVWDPLNFSSADAEPSPIIGMTTLFRQLWIFKQNSTEVWNNAGTAGFSFQRMQGVYLQVGCLAPFSIATTGDRVLWLGQNAFGSHSVYMNNGYEAQAVSTKAIDYQIASYMKATQKGAIDATAFVYSQAGHPFYVITFPGGNATWVYDLSTQLWHERGEWIGGVYNRWDPSSYCYYNKQHIVGSSSTQQLSFLDLTYPIDDLVPLQSINPKRWMRRWRALPKAINEPIRFNSLRLDMQTGQLDAIPAPIIIPPFPPDMVLWLDASVLTQANASLVPVWSDISPARTVTTKNNVVTAGYQMQYYTAAINGHPGVQTFRGQEWFSAAINWGSAVGGTIFAVLKNTFLETPVAPNTIGTTLGLEFSNNASTSSSSWPKPYSSLPYKITDNAMQYKSTYFADFINITPTQNTTLASPWMYTKRATSTGMTYKLNRVLLGTTTTPFVIPQRALIGMTQGDDQSAYTQANGATNITYAEIIVYARALSDAEIVKVETYLSAKWGTP